MRKKIALILSAVMAVGMFGGTSLSSAVMPQKTTYAEELATDEFANPVYDVETDTTNWDYIYYGTYPQTEISGSALTEAIVNAEYTDDIASVGEDKYLRMKQENATASTRRELKGLEYPEEAFYTWTDNKTYHYFKYEPVKWRVLQVEEDGTLLVMTDEAIDCQKYSTNMEKYTWEDSPMRVWLNSYSAPAANGYVCAGNGFIDHAFTKEEQSDIMPTALQTDDCDLWGQKIDGGIDTSDKLFLMSVTEITKQEYGFAPDAMTLSSTRRVEPSEYAFAMGAWLGSYNDYYGSCWWMLRTPGDYYQKMGLVYRTGQVYKEGYYVNTPYYGVVPAMHVKADSQYLMTEKEYEDKYSVMAGDVNEDGKVSLDDAQQTLKIALGIISPADMSEKAMKAADVDQSGKIELADAQLVLKYALGIINSFDTVTTAQAVVTTVKEATEEAIEYTPSPASGKIWLAADSIAAQHANETGLAASSLTVKTRDTIGWGVIFANYFKDGVYNRYEDGKLIETNFTANVTDAAVVVNNTALSSRSSKSYTAEANYTTMMENIGKGDYLFISFGHNDEYPQVERYTDPYGDSSTEGSYKWYVKNYYIDPALKAGATPVLVSSVAKRNFIDGKLQPQFHEAYATAMQELSEEYAQKGITIKYIDLQHQMVDLYEELGDDATKLLHASYDVTEFSSTYQSTVFDTYFTQMYADRELTDLSNEEVVALMEAMNKDGYVNNETSGSYMDNVHFTFAGAEYATKYILQGLKDNGLDLYELTDEEAVSTLDSIESPAIWKEQTIYAK